MNRKIRRAAGSGSKRPPIPPGPGADPTFLQSFLDEGSRLLAAGRDGEATEIAKRAIRLQETPASKKFFVTCVKRWSYFPGAQEVADLVARALREAWTMPAELAGISRGILNHDPVIAPAIRRAAAAWPHRLPIAELMGVGGLVAAATNPVLLAVLETGKVVGLDIEYFLTSLRAGLLDIADNTTADQHAIRLACALARQSISNDYVFHLTADEQARVSALHDRTAAALSSNTAIAALAIAVLGAYLPLHSLSENALLKRSWPKAVAELLQEVIRQAAAERQHRETIPRLTAVTHAVSLKVRQQYEEHPYPRWDRLPTDYPSMPVDEWFRTFFPRSAFRSIGQPGGPDVLIGGCGTGRHSILFARAYPGAKVLAVDLSLASLSYAKEKTRAMGLNNIEYAQADILELGSLDRKFDVISSSGVLHHLADPERGWRVLLSLLRPDGCMHIGLYSKLAWRDIIAAREWAAAQGFGSSAEEIRRARQAIAAAAPNQPSFSNIVRRLDFYNTSECRDLLFHEQVHEFTIPQIATFLEQNDLQFLGFSLGDVVGHFVSRFGVQNETDLRAWHQFETENPSAFQGMYEFWIQKRRRF